ncbi:hypothetical protein BH09BAC5_BH09BAC5_23020 [soil metagenome]
MRRLRKEKRFLEAKIDKEKTELYLEIAEYKNSLWPFRIFNQFKRTADVLSENKLLVIGAQLAYAALNSAKEKKAAKQEDSGDSEPKTKTGLVDFLKDVANKFLEQYVNKDKE